MGPEWCHNCQKAWCAVEVVESGPKKGEATKIKNCQCPGLVDYDYYTYVYEDLGKDLFDQSHNLLHSSLYPDVLKIKTIIVEKQNFAKMPFDYYYKFISDNSAAWTSWQHFFD